MRYKNNIKKYIATVLAVAIMAAGINVAPVYAAAMKLSATNISLKVGGTKTLKVKNNTSNKKVTWSTSNKYSVTVSSGGKVTAVKSGFATIKAVCGSKSFKCRVVVPDAKRTMTLSNETLNIYEGSTYQLKATAPYNYTFSSMNTAIATVGKTTGLIKGVNPGTTQILVSCGTCFRYCTVNVLQASSLLKPESSSLYNKSKRTVRRYSNKGNPQYGTIVWAKGQKIRFGVANLNAPSTKKVVWTVSDPTKVSKPVPNSNGTRAYAQTLAKGKTKVIATVTYKNNKKVAYSATVHVSAPKVNKKKLYLFAAGAGSNRQRYVTFSGLKNRSRVTYTNSSNKARATLVGKKCKVLGNKKGSGTITARVDGKKFKIKYYIKAIKLNGINAVLAKNYTTQIKVGGIGNLSVKYSSENHNIATVDSNGVIKGIKSGVVYIDVKVSTMTFRYRVDVAAKGMKTIIKKADYIVNNWKYSQAKRLQSGYYDCSALVWKGYKAYGSYHLKLGGSNSTALPAGDLFDYLYKRNQIIYLGFTKVDDLKPGDLLFYGDYDSAVKYSTPGRTLDIYHVSMYAGNGRVVEKGGQPVTYNNLDHVVGVGRVVN